MPEPSEVEDSKGNLTPIAYDRSPQPCLQFPGCGTKPVIRQSSAYSCKRKSVKHTYEPLVHLQENRDVAVLRVIRKETQDSVNPNRNASHMMDLHVNGHRRSMPKVEYVLPQD